MSTHDPERLEAAIHRILRSVPDRKAPAGFEARVLAELSRRASLPWWRRSYAHWPAPVRATFFVGSALAAALLVSGLIALGRTPEVNEIAGAAQPFAWLGAARQFVNSIDHNIRLVIGAIPPLWLYGSVAAIAASYAALGAIGAATYRALSLGRHPQ